MTDQQIITLNKLLLKDKWRSSDEVNNITYSFTSPDIMYVKPDIPSTPETITSQWKFLVSIENEVLTLNMIGKNFIVLSIDSNKIELKHPLGYNLTLTFVV